MYRNAGVENHADKLGRHRGNPFVALGGLQEDGPRPVSTSSPLTVPELVAQGQGRRLVPPAGDGGSHLGVQGAAVGWFHGGRDADQDRRGTQKPWIE